MSQDAACKGINTAETIVVDGGNLANVFVYVKDGLGTRTFDVPNDRCHHQPAGLQISSACAGRDGRAKHRDQERRPDHAQHSSHAGSPTASGTNRNRRAAAPIEKNFAREEIMLPVKCNQHPWMRMYINVVKSPFYAVTGPDGKYEIKGLPPGTYTIAFVQEKLGEQTQTGHAGREGQQDCRPELQAAVACRYIEGTGGRRPSLNYQAHFTPGVQLEGACHTVQSRPSPLCGVHGVLRHFAC